MENSLDPAANPYAPGAGTRPPLLAGRAEEERDLAHLLARLKLGYVESPRLYEGVRGVGKTVLLLTLRDQVRAAGGLAVHIQARSGMGTLSGLVENIEREVARVSLARSAKDAVLDALAHVKISVAGVSLGGVVPVEQTADPVGDLLETFTKLARLSLPLVITIDELQEANRAELSVLLVGLQRAAGDGLPIGVLAAGLPGTQATAAEAESFAERMFVTSRLGPLSEQAATAAVSRPADDIGVTWTVDALRLVVEESAGFPFFLQHFAAATWNAATSAHISVDDAARGIEDSERALDRSLVESRLRRLSARERAYVEAMADLGPGPHGSRDVAARMGTTSDKIGSARRRLIDAGVLYSPSYGRVDFTVPLFDRLILRRRGSSP